MIDLRSNAPAATAPSSAVSSATSATRASPRGEARRKRQLSVAREHFLEQGFAATSINDIARDAGGSLATLYRNFGSKEGLFLAVMQQEAKSVWALMDQQVSDGSRPAQALERFGMAILSLALQPRLIRLLRGLAFESGRTPELGRLFLENGPDVTRQRLADYLSQQVKKGTLPASGLGTQPLNAANMLMGMLLSPLHIDALLGRPDRTDSMEIHRPHVQRCVRVFVAGFGAN
ncbi:MULTISPECIES: TetR/AcrR family transcriptional regulator [Cobetia]|uniref:TetR/AcrR family transcriptional regulator n=1 Tax=Cobetia crustatorum TaxID=553385 RepID=A0A558HUV4_9GAMM|nr:MULTISPECIES: TetR/AcrR family transcriptional regulator [Cobetia]TVU72912.1 TetR/AcrR family transcriptional regulator [Cobetia crustatorum]